MRSLKLNILMALVPLIWAGCAAGQGYKLVDIEEFVRQRFIHGIPFEEASRYDASVVPTLLDMLNDPGKQEYWSNVVVTLGIIGDKKAVEPMIEFIRKGQVEPPSRNRSRAKKSALVALGYLINESGDRKALEYLKKNMIPSKSLPERTGFSEGQSGDGSKYIVIAQLPRHREMNLN